MLGGGAVACGSPPPAAPAATAQAPNATGPKEPSIDTSPVPAPPGLVVIARVNKPDAIVSAVGSWTRLPLPSGADLVRSITDDAVADVVDVSQPVDAALSIGLSRRGVDPLAAFSVAVKSYEQAKTKLAEKHRLVAGPNGQFKVEGLGKKTHHSAQEDEDDGDDDGDGCVLAPAAQGARIVCGERAALEALVPFLSRTMPREKWSSDLHVEVNPEPVRAPLQEMRASIPVLARSLLGAQSPAVRELIDSSLGELMDIVNDAQKLTIDAQIAESGIVADTRFELQSNKSVFARAITADRADSPPPAFWHLPGDTDTAFFGRGSDPKLFEHPRELLAKMMLEGAEAAGIPEAERKAIRDLVADRMLSLFTSGTGIYGKGYDQAAIEKAAASLKAVKPENRAAVEEAKRVLLEQVAGWHLYQVSEPIAKVGPVLKDWSLLWNRPAFAKWAQAKAEKGMLPRMRISPLPAGVTLPKETVHLEITIPREDVVEEPAAAARQPGPVTAKAPPAPGKAKKIARKPIVFHVLAVPDGGATWLGFGLDAKLVAQKAAASLASAPDANTLGKTTGIEPLREGKMNGGGIMTLRGFMVFAALDRHGDRSPLALLAGLPHKGGAPIVFTGKAEAPSANVKGGASVGQLRVSRAVIEDIVKLATTAR